MRLFLPAHWIRFGKLAVGSAVCLSGLSACGGAGAPSVQQGAPAVPVPVPVPPDAGVQLAPVISMQPQAQAVQGGQTVTFFVGAGGSGPLSYQWTRNGVPVDGATAPTFTVSAAALADSGDVLRVTVRNGAGTIESAPALLTVNGSGVRALAGSAGLAYRPAQFEAATGIAPHPAGGIYHAGGRNLVRIAPDGKVTSLATDPACELFGGAADKDGNFYTSCAGALMKFGPDGTRLPAPGAGLTGLSQRLSLAIDIQGRIWVADTGRNVLWRIEAGGAVSRVAGVGTASAFTQLGTIAADPRGGVVAVDQHAIVRVNAVGLVSMLAGEVRTSGKTDGSSADARFYFPDGLAVDAAGTVYVADTQNRVVRRIAADGAVTTLAGGGGAYRNEDGPGKLAGFFLPRSMLLDAQGRLLVSDTDTLRGITPEGAVSTIAGTRPIDRPLAWIDGIGKEARFQLSRSMTIDSAGNLFVADTRSHAIRKVTAAGVVTTLAGGPHTCPGVDAVCYPGDIALGANGVLYVTDGAYPDFPKTLRRIGTDGVVSTIAVAGEPLRVAADGLGNLFVATRIASQVTVIRIAPDGKTTILLTGGTTAQDFLSVSGMVADKAGNLFILKGESILRIDPAGAVTRFLAEDKALPRFISAIAPDGQGGVVFATFQPLTSTGYVQTAWPLGAVGRVSAQGVVSVIATPEALRPFGEAGSIAVDSAGAIYVGSSGSILKLVLP